MNNLIQKIKRAYERIRAYFPSRLPQGMEEADAWSERIIRMSGLPQNDSIKFALCVKVLHLGEADSSKPDEFFIRSLHKAAANQVVSQIINDLKTKQKAAEEAVKIPAEATAAQAVHESQG